VDVKPLFGPGGVLIAAMTSEFNDHVMAIALPDIGGALGISPDSQTWIESLYVSAEIIGMAILPWLLMTFTLRRWTIFAINTALDVSVAGGISRQLKSGIERAPRGGPTAGPAPRRPSTGSGERA
jgi:hypothetical protein